MCYVGMHLLTAVARDVDSEQNGQIEYSLPGEYLSDFALGNTSGNLTLSRVVRRSERP